MAEKETETEAEPQPIVIDGVAFTPNADELYVAMNSEEIGQATQDLVSGVLGSVSTFLNKLGMVLFVLLGLPAAVYAGTTVEAPGVRVQTGQPCCVTPAPQVIRNYEYRDEERVVQVPRRIETVIVPRITTRTEYVDEHVTVEADPVDVCAEPVQRATYVDADPCCVGVRGHGVDVDVRDTYHPLNRGQIRRLKRSEQKAAKLRMLMQYRASRQHGTYAAGI